MPALPRFSSLLVAAVACLAVLLVGRMPRANDATPPLPAVVEELPPPQPTAPPTAPAAPLAPAEPIAVPAPNAAPRGVTSPRPPARAPSSPVNLPAPAPLNTPATPAIPGEQELLRLRARLGSPFEGTVLERTQDGSASDQDAFAEALRQAAEQLPPLRTSATLPLPSAVPPTLPPTLPTPPAAEPSEYAEPLTSVRKASVRRAAQRVDRLADELEELECCYDEADQLRAVADMLRARAR